MKLRLRQVDVSDAAGVGRWKVVKLEAGEIDDLTFAEVHRCFAALGAQLKPTWGEYEAAGHSDVAGQPHEGAIRTALPEQPS